MTTLMQASNQWATRPDDERFVDLDVMGDAMRDIRRRSRETVVSSRRLEVVSPSGGQLLVTGPGGTGYQPTHWAMGQLCGLVGAPAKYIRGLPAPLAADCLTYGLRYERDAKDTGVLVTKGTSFGTPGEFRAATGPNYGRLWNLDIVEALRKRFGNGVDGDWRVPGEFGVKVEVSKSNTTLFASDRDMFVFLADEENRVEFPGRRNGKSGPMARGFFVWNSEVGSRSFGIATFFFDYVCCNRIVWGAQGLNEITFRHTASAPDKFIEQAMPQLKALSQSSEKPFLSGLEAAREAKIDDLQEWLAKRKIDGALADRMSQVHMLEEERPIENVWDAVTAATAVARDVPYQDARVDLERMAGKWLDGVAASRVTADELGL